MHGANRAAKEDKFSKLIKALNIEAKVGALRGQFGEIVVPDMRMNHHVTEREGASAIQ
jgi:hypothetical protein